MPGQDRDRSRPASSEPLEDDDLEGFQAITPPRPEFEGEKWKKRIESELDELEEGVQAAAEGLEGDGGLDEKWDRLEGDARRRPGPRTESLGGTSDRPSLSDSDFDDCFDKSDS